VIYKRAPQRRRLDTTLYSLIALASVFYLGRFSPSTSLTLARATGDVASFREYDSRASETSTANSNSNTLRSVGSNWNIKSDLPIEIWASQSQPHPNVADVRAALNSTEIEKLQQLSTFF
jgi:hypothetical protein